MFREAVNSIIYIKLRLNKSFITENYVAKYHKNRIYKILIQQGFFYKTLTPCFMEKICFQANVRMFAIKLYPEYDRFFTKHPVQLILAKLA